MTKKQRKMCGKIIISFIMFAALFVSQKLLLLSECSRIVLLLLYLIPYVLIGYDVVSKAFINIKNGQVFDENFLMTIATFAAFAIEEYQEALAVMLFYQVGELFQDIAVGRSRDSIKHLMSIVPEYANLVTDDGFEEVDPDDVEIGDILIVKPGEKIPLDGVVIEGSSFVDTAALTGESMPASISVGDDVISGCINRDSTFKMRVSKAYEDSTVSRILELVEDSGTRKARLEGFITRFARVYTPIVTVCALALAIIPPLALGGGFGEWISRACIFLIVSCPCALVISVPLGFFGGIGSASRIGVLIKGGNFLEALSMVSTVVFDKTGTLTKGEFRVNNIIPADGKEKEELLYKAAIIESFSSHPIAESIVREYADALDLSNASDIKEIGGHGMSGTIEDNYFLAGNSALMEKENIEYTPWTGGGTVIYFAENGQFIGTIVISDSIKVGVKDALIKMKQTGIRSLVMLTGDRVESANEIADELGIDKTYAKLLPQDKVTKVENIIDSQKGNDKVAFVGDGINDAPVLMRADVGIAMGSMGSDAAIEAADIVIMDDDIAKIVSVISISKRTIRIVKENIVFAIGVKLIVLALGALGLTTMWVAVFADVGVAIIAILNSMRALRFR